jgi:hypothetical protein
MSFIYHDDDAFHSVEKVDRVFHTTDPRIPKDWIETAAYFQWEREGRPHGESWAHWLEAEKKLMEKLPKAPKPPVPEETPSPKGDTHDSWLA